MEYKNESMGTGNVIINIIEKLVLVTMVVINLMRAYSCIGTKIWMGLLVIMIAYFVVALIFKHRPGESECNMIKFIKKWYVDTFELVWKEDVEELEYEIEQCDKALLRNEKHMYISKQISKIIEDKMKIEKVDDVEEIKAFIDEFQGALSKEHERLEMNKKSCLESLEEAKKEDAIRESWSNYFNGIFGGAWLTIRFTLLIIVSVTVFILDIMPVLRIL